jgi:hypothetical protein
MLIPLPVREDLKPSPTAAINASVSGNSSGGQPFPHVLTFFQGSALAVVRRISLRDFNLSISRGIASLLLTPKKEIQRRAGKPQPIQRSKGGGNRLTISFAKRYI